MEKTHQKAAATRLVITEKLNERKYRVEIAGEKGSLYISNSYPPQIQFIYEGKKGWHRDDATFEVTTHFISKSDFEQALAEFNKSKDKGKAPITPAPDGLALPKQVLSAALEIPEAIDFAETLRKNHLLSGVFVEKAGKRHMLSENLENKSLQLIKKHLKSVKVDREQLYADKAIDTMAGQILNAIKQGQLGIENGKVIELKKPKEFNENKAQGAKAEIHVYPPFDSANSVIERIVNYAQRVMKPLLGDEPIQFSDPASPSVPSGVSSTRWRT